MVFRAMTGKKNKSKNVSYMLFLSMFCFWNYAPYRAFGGCWIHKKSVQHRPPDFEILVIFSMKLWARIYDPLS